MWLVKCYVTGLKCYICVAALNTKLFLRLAVLFYPGKLRFPSLPVGRVRCSYDFWLWSNGQTASAKWKSVQYVKLSSFNRGVFRGGLRVQPPHELLTVIKAWNYFNVFIISMCLLFQCVYYIDICTIWMCLLFHFDVFTISFWCVYYFNVFTKLRLRK